MFARCYEHWPWREEVQDKSTHPSILVYVFRAWNAFYLSYDFTSAIHNAIKWTDERHLTAALTRVLAASMYGCRYSYKKKKYAIDYVFHTNLYDDAFPIKNGSIQRLKAEMIDWEDRKRKFFKKNWALTNVERHTWKPSALDFSRFFFSEAEKEVIVKAWYTDWDNRYGFYLENGWMYFYRSHVIICRFKFIYSNNKLYSIEKVEDCDDGHDSRELLDWINENHYSFSCLNDC